jgi:hypothetical protein
MMSPPFEGEFSAAVDVGQQARFVDATGACPALQAVAISLDRRRIESRATTVGAAPSHRFACRGNFFADALQKNLTDFGCVKDKFFVPADVTKVTPVDLAEPLRATRCASIVARHDDVSRAR